MTHHNQTNELTIWFLKYATHIPHSVHVWSLAIRISRGPRIATFRESSTDLDGSHSSREKGIPDYIPSTPTDRSVGSHLVSLPLIASEAVGLIQDSVDDDLLGLLGPYTSM
jgi:hypothetical protein